ncbi:hypothetical protein Esti_003016 [Eimeria stiedai]
MEVPSDEGGGEEYEENEEFVFDDDCLVGSSAASPMAKSLVPLCHSIESLDQRINELALETASLIGLDEAIAGVLLRAFDWQTDALVQEWFNDSAAVLKKVRLPPEVAQEEEGPTVPSSGGKGQAAGGAPLSSHSSSEASGGPQRGAPRIPSDETKKECFECPVTASVVPLSETFALKCGHRYSNEAWVGYLDTLLSEGPRRALDARCPFFGCLELVPTSAWQSFCGPEAVERLRMFAREQFVAKRQAVAWCPSPKCERAVELVPAGSGVDSCDSSASLCALSTTEIAAASDVTCACGARFCVMCGNEPHRPISCRVIAAWARKNVREADSVAWISCNTQPCPKCRRPIQKDMGCMHMRCYCQHEFCWLCLGDWKQHSTMSFYRCNIYERRNEEGKEDRSKADTQHSLERYAHFFERYRAHSHGQQVAAGMQVEQLRRCRDIAAGVVQTSPRRVRGSTAHEADDRVASSACVAKASSRESEARSLSVSSRRGGAPPPSGSSAVYSSAPPRAEEMRVFGANFDWDFLESGWMQVIECRRMLKWSYAFAYFAEFPESRQKHLFEFHQGQLERNLDILQEKLETFDASEYLDKDVSELLNFKIQLVDLTSVVRGFFAKIFDVFEDEFVAGAVHLDEREVC